MNVIFFFIFWFLIDFILSPGETIAQQCCDMLHCQVAIVWPGRCMHDDQTTVIQNLVLKQESGVGNGEREHF